MQTGHWAQRLRLPFSLRVRFYFTHRRQPRKSRMGEATGYCLIKPGEKDATNATDPMFPVSSYSPAASRAAGQHSLHLTAESPPLAWASNRKLATGKGYPRESQLGGNACSCYTLTLSRVSKPSSGNSCKDLGQGS